MPPRKRAAPSSTSSRKLTHAPQSSQPSKFGIQHFFERHSQATADASSQCTPSAADPPPPAAEEPHSQISPEFSKSDPLKRFKFSPGMLIKQSQDDVCEEVIWKISPVNERLKALKAAQLPRPMRIFPETPGSGVSLLRPCSENQTLSSLAGRIEKWLSSLLADKCVASSSRGSPLLPEGSNRCPSNGKISSTGAVELGSPFRTPPSTAYGTNELVGGVASNGDLDQSGRQHRKALLELLDQVEDANTEESQPSNSMPCNGHDATRDNMDVDNSPITDVAPIPSKRTFGAPRDVTFFVLEFCLQVSEKHKTAESSSTQSPYKVLRLLDEQSGQERTLHLYD